MENCLDLDTDNNNHKVISSQANCPPPANTKILVLGGDSYIQEPEVINLENPSKSCNASSHIDVGGRVQGAVGGLINEDTVYFCGGERGPYNDTFCYFFQSDETIDYNYLNESRIGAASVGDYGVVAILGGNETSSFELINTNFSMAIPELSYPFDIHHHCMLSMVDDNTNASLFTGLIVLGGRSGLNVLFEVHTIRADSGEGWDEYLKIPDLIYARELFACGLVANQQIIVAGGIGEYGQVLDSVEYFDWHVGYWQRGKYRF